MQLASSCSFRWRVQQRQPRRFACSCLLCCSILGFGLVAAGAVLRQLAVVPPVQLRHYLHWRQRKPGELLVLPVELAPRRKPLFEQCCPSCGLHHLLPHHHRRRHHRLRPHHLQHPHPPLRIPRPPPHLLPLDVDGVVAELEGMPALGGEVEKQNLIVNSSDKESQINTFWMKGFKEKGEVRKNEQYTHGRLLTRLLDGQRLSTIGSLLLYIVSIVGAQGLLSLRCCRWLLLILLLLIIVIGRLSNWF